MTDPFSNAVSAAQAAVSAAQAAVIAADTIEAQLSSANQEVTSLQGQVGALTSSAAATQALLDADAALIAKLQVELAQQTPSWVRPTGTAYVRYEDLYVTGDTLLAVMSKADPTKILTFPAGQFALPGGFADPKGYNAAMRCLCKGIVGSGIDQTVFVHPAHSTTQTNTQAKGTASPFKLIDQANGNAGITYAGFTIKGGDQSCTYSGIAVQGASPLVQQVKFKAAHRGNANFPPGETTGLSSYKATNFTATDVEVDCTDDTGARVGSSPFGGNVTTGLALTRCYFHHANAGTTTFWTCSGIVTTDVRSEHNGSGGGSLNGNGINHEQCTGSISHTRPVIVLDAAGGNSGLHMSLSANVGSAKVQVSDPVIDVGPYGAGVFSIYSATPNYAGSAETQLHSDVTVTLNGQPMPVRFSA